jgi:5-methylcytosine-specific restriction protein A
MALADLTDSNAVLDAIREADRLGHDVFLRQYGYRPSRQYFLVQDGRRYDSKAIAGVAHGLQHRSLGAQGILNQLEIPKADWPEKCR